MVTKYLCQSYIYLCITEIYQTFVYNPKSGHHERSRKYRSTNVYTRSYIRHHTVQCEVNVAVDASESGATSRVARSFGSNKLYICLSNKCFNCIQRICCLIDIRPSQDHRILCVQTVQINLAITWKLMSMPLLAEMIQVLLMPFIVMFFDEFYLS